MTQPKLIIWDFDGVICDSLVECLTVTTMATARIEQPGLSVTNQNLHEICRADIVMSLYERMRPLRPFIVKGQDYLWQYFHLDAFQSTPESFEKYQAVFDSVFDPDTDRRYETFFYESRKQLQQLMQQQYFTLFTAYPGVLYAFRYSLLRHRNYVCTARDQDGVSLLFGNNAINFPREKIYSKDFNGPLPNPGMGKSRQILEILDREGGSAQDFLLVEDQVKAPAELKEACPGMEVIYAAYGYGLAHDWQNAHLGRVRQANKPEDVFHNIY